MSDQDRPRDDPKSDRDDHAPGYEREARVFLELGLQAVSLTIEMLDDERSRARRLIERNGWSDDEGMRSIFSRGLVALEHDREAIEHEGKRLIDMKTPEERDRFLLARLNELESKYSVMKFTAFNALKDNQSLRMNVTGLSTEYQALSAQNKYLREREDELRARVESLTAIAAPVMTASPKTRWERARSFLRNIIK